MKYNQGGAPYGDLQNKWINNFIVAAEDGNGNAASDFDTFAHELMHLFLDRGHDGQRPWNLFNSNSNAFSPVGNRRISEAQTNEIYNSLLLD